MALAKRIVKSAEAMLPRGARPSALRADIRSLETALKQLRRELANERRESAKLRKDLSRESELAELTRVLTRGEPLAQALATYLRSRDGGASRNAATAIAQSLMANPETRSAGLVPYAMTLTEQALHENALVAYAELGPDLYLHHCPIEYFDSALSVDYSSNVAAFDEFLNGNLIQLSWTDRLRAVTLFAKHLDFEKVGIWLNQLNELAKSNGLDEETSRQLTWLNIRQANLRLEVAEDPDAIKFAVMDYKLHDRNATSSNIGDYVQTLAANSHLLRFSNVEFVGEPELVKVLNQYREGLKPKKRIAEPQSKVQLVSLNRDQASDRSYPENTWLISNGWFTHRNFKGEADFPLPKNVNPLLISVHVEDERMLDAKTVAWLNEHGPVGCRDWTTVYLLREAGVECFFSGCLTTTIGQLFSTPEKSDPNKIALVEAFRPDGSEGKAIMEFTQVWDGVRDLTLAEGLEQVGPTLQRYYGFGRILSMRIHCYLPARSIGLPVEFAPKYGSDSRFDGLVSQSDEQYQAMRDALDAKLQTMLTLILSGKGKAEVYAAWRELVADDVVAATQHCAESNHLPASSVDFAAVSTTLVQSAEHFAATNAPAGQPLQLAFAFDQNLVRYFPAVLRSVELGTARGADIHLLTRGISRSYVERLVKAFPRFAFHHYPFDSVDYGAQVKTLPHISVSTMDRLLLPLALPHLDRVTYLDVDIMVKGDLAELENVELGDLVLAGKRSRTDYWSRLTMIVDAAAKTLSPALARHLRRELHLNNRIAQTLPINAGVIVLNLAKMREESFSERYMYLVEHCRLNDQDVLNIYAGNRLKYLETEWNVIPWQDHVAGPKLVHWAGPVKAWGPDFVMYKGDWQELQAWADSAMAER